MMRRRLIFIVVLALLSSHVVFSQTQAAWPTKGWEKSSPEKQKMDISRLSALHEKIKNGDYGYVDGMHIFRNGYLVYEKYYQHDYVKINKGRDRSPGMYNYYNPDWHPFYKGSKLHTLQSVTKSVTSILIGIAINRGEIPGVDAKILDFFNVEKILNVDGRKKKLTLEDVLTMRTGIEWNESIPYTDPRNSCIQMEKSEDWFKFVINLPVTEEPGTVFEYNSGASLLLSAIIKETTGMYIDKYAEKYLFKPLGIPDYYWKRTPTQLPDTEGGLYLKPHDLAKIGYLYLNNGVWEGKQVVPSEWVKASLHPQVKDVAPENDRFNWAYGYQWRLLPNRFTKSYVYACTGYGGQYLLIAPEYKLIAVFNGWNIYDTRTLPLRAFYNYVYKAVY
jgi:CubicO group peptidase (beta-lactamase class C family)